MPNVHMFCTQIRPNQKVRPDLDPNCVKLMIFLILFLEKVDCEKNQLMTKKHAKLPSMKRINFLPSAGPGLGPYSLQRQ